MRSSLDRRIMAVLCRRACQDPRPLEDFYDTPSGAGGFVHSTPPARTGHWEYVPRFMWTEKVWRVQESGGAE